MCWMSDRGVMKLKRTHVAAKILFLLFLLYVHILSTQIYQYYAVPKMLIMYQEEMNPVFFTLYSFSMQTSFFFVCTNDLVLSHFAKNL